MLAMLDIRDAPWYHSVTTFVDHAQEKSEYEFIFAAAIAPARFSAFRRCLTA